MKHNFITQKSKQCTCNENKHRRAKEKRLRDGDHNGKI